jgi:hypothetical protein
MKPIAIIYTCRNPGQVALLWAWQPPPFGHGWIDIKAEPLVRLSDVRTVMERSRSLICGSEYGTAFKRKLLEDINALLTHQGVTP